MARLIFLFLMAILLNSIKAASQLHLKEIPDSLKAKPTLKVLPPNFYNQQGSFFCHKEIQVQQLTRLPLFFRLGSKDYVDYLEKKPNTGRINRP
ncbi:MAG: hypothetical protein ACXVM0_15470 [Flavisolibacter sp.]